MNDYEIVLIDIYKKVYKESYIPSWIKELSNMLKILLGTIVISYALMFILILSFIFLKNKYQVIGFILSFIIFIISLILYLILFVKEVKKSGTVQEKRRKKYKRIKDFSIILNSYGYHKEQLEYVIDYLDTKNNKIRKKKEREHDLFFKYTVTIILSLIIFFSKELIELLKSDIPEEVYKSILITVLFIFFIFLFVSILLFLSRMSTFDYKKTNSEKLVDSLVDVQIFRSGVEMVKEIEVLRKETKTFLLEDLL